MNLRIVFWSEEWYLINSQSSHMLRVRLRGFLVFLLLLAVGLLQTVRGGRNKFRVS